MTVLTQKLVVNLHIKRLIQIQKPLLLSVLLTSNNHFNVITNMIERVHNWSHEFDLHGMYHHFAFVDRDITSWIFKRDKMLVVRQKGRCQRKVRPLGAKKTPPMPRLDAS